MNNSNFYSKKIIVYVRMAAKREISQYVIL